MAISLETVKDWATIIGVFIGVVSLIYTAYNARLTMKTNRARFWLDMRDRFSRFDSIHVKLRPGGAWAEGGPITEEEWAQVEAYMGLFEHCELMLRQRLLDESTFGKIYKYRVEMILRNKRIVEEKLVKQRKDWREFLDLMRRFGLEHRGSGAER